MKRERIPNAKSGKTSSMKNWKTSSVKNWKVSGTKNWKTPSTNFPYTDIVNLKPFKDPSRKPLPISARAAQFMPFKSLNEYENYIVNKTSDINLAEDESYQILENDEGLGKCVTQN